MASRTGCQYDSKGPAGGGIPIEVAGDYAGNAFGLTDGPNSSALFYNPNDVQVDPSGNIIVADYLNNAIRLVQGGSTNTIAGGTQGNVDGIGGGASFNTPTGVALGNGNVIYVCDLSNNIIRRILPGGLVKTIAGNTGQKTTQDGIGTAAYFNHPVDMVIDPSGNGYFVDGQNNNVRKIILTGYSIDQPLPAGLSFDGTTGIISGTPAVAFSSMTFSITAYNASGYSAATVILSCTMPAINNWTGGTSAWTTASNWSQNHVPLTNETVEIGASAYSSGTAQPLINASTTVKSIIFGTNSSPLLTIGGTQALTVTNGLTVNPSSSGTIAGPGTIILSGNSNILPSGSLTASSDALSRRPAIIITGIR